MREPRPIAGAKTPLFDRLLDDQTGVRQPLSSTRAMDSSALRESVRDDVGRLLNTRSNLRGKAQALARGTVIDYGIPNLSPISPASEADCSSLATLLEHVISGFEPRLKNVRVLIQQDKRDPRALLGAVYGNLVMGNVAEPVYFPLAIDESGKKISMKGS